jgi:nicotinamidase-related amidase
MRLQRNDTLLLVIDVQEKLMHVIDRAAETERNIERLVRGFHLLDVPALLTEQYVRGLGPSTPVVRTAFEESGGYTPIEKSCFSGYGCSEFVMALRNLRRKHVVISGIEAHVCVYQTTADLLANGYDVTIVADAISSRAAENREIALRRMVTDGARLSSTEMVLFELTVESGTDEFRSISRLVK